ncbi:MAG TPA: hypothetical protein VGD08_23805 [Stellaceae bacterium]|jgi:hypothetical protein
MRITGLGVLGLGLLLAACGSTNEEQAASGGLTGVAAGALVGGPVGAVVGGAVGAAGGTAMPKGADQYAEEGVDKIKQEAGTSHRTGTTAASGTSTAGGPRLSRVDVRNRLRDDGWANVSNVSRWGNDFYTANAQKDGVNYRLEVDGNTGRIVDQRRI